MNSPKLHVVGSVKTSSPMSFTFRADNLGQAAGAGAIAAVSGYVAIKATEKVVSVGVKYTRRAWRSFREGFKEGFDEATSAREEAKAAREEAKAEAKSRKTAQA